VKVGRVRRTWSEDIDREGCVEVGEEQFKHLDGLEDGELAECWEMGCLISDELLFGIRTRLWIIGFDKSWV